ncbi:MAG: sugar phosphate isomerase/epimerase [Planctomycetes bacterium]|jgi:sugar phosphate isomerase/epimerase|nr:sugar phosphate isomerase/epimerase [Planctomycetota bacterium]
MRFTLSTHLLVYHELNEQALAALAESPWSGLEIWLAEPHVRWRDLAAMADLRQDLALHGLHAETVHLPLYPSVQRLIEMGERWSLIDSDATERATALEGMCAGVAAAAALGAWGAVLHLGWPNDDWSHPTSGFAQQALETLLQCAREHDIVLLPENILSDGTSCTALAALLDKLDPGRSAGICLDFGHAHLTDSVVAEAKRAGTRVKHLHLHDNDGESDAHLHPGQGTIDFDEAFTHLGTSAFSGTAAWEIRDYSRGQKTPRELVQSVVQSCSVWQA